MSEDFRVQKIEIPAPRRSVYARGKASKAKQAPIRSLRIPDEEYKRIQEAAFACDMSMADFVRWCAGYAANHVLDQVRLHGFVETSTKKDLSDYE